MNLCMFKDGYQPRPTECLRCTTGSSEDGVEMCLGTGHLESELLYQRQLCVKPAAYLCESVNAAADAPESFCLCKQAQVSLET